MATIKLCDWTKKRLTNEEVFKLTLNGVNYEVCAEAFRQLKQHLEGDEAPQTPQKVARAPQQVQATPTPEGDVGINVEASSPFTGPAQPGLLDDALAAPRPAVPPIAIPTSTKERLPMPTAAQADAVIAESQRFPEGKLHTLTPGKARTAAQNVLKTKWEDRFEDTKRQVPERFKRGD